MRLIAFLLFLTVSFQFESLNVAVDKGKNQNIASTEAIELKLKDSYVTKNLDLKIQQIFEKERPIQRPENAHLVFRALSHRWRFLEESERQVNLVIDGEKYSPSIKPTYTSVVGEKYLEETLTYEVKLSVIEKLAKASNVEIQIGAVEGKIREKQLSKVKDFLNSLLKQ
jgi:hypothetical protein